MIDPEGADFPDQLQGTNGDKVASGAEPASLQHDADLSAACDSAKPYETKTQPDALASLAESPETESAGPSPVRTPPAVLPVVDIIDLDWVAVRDSIDSHGVRHRMRESVSQMEDLLSRTSGAGMLFDSDRSFPDDKAIRVAEIGKESLLWFIGDLHGDLLALEAALLLIRSYGHQNVSKSRIVFLGDLFDDEGFGLEVLLRVFEVTLENPALVCVIAGNHDEALGHDGTRFISTVSPSDFSEYLNANSADEWITRAGKLAIRLFSHAPRALFFPDGLLVAHGGFPLTDLHVHLQTTGEWNDAACLSDFVWTRAHPTARKKIPNRFTRGSQFGYEDFAAFCSLALGLGRPVTHMVRGHDHVEQRFAVYPAYCANPILTTVALARRLPRELFGTSERTPTVALYTEGALPQVFRLHVPAALIAEFYPERPDSSNVQLEASSV